jgi:hypothetical protein
MALPLTWCLENVQFDDAGRSEGFFTFEWPTGTNEVVPLDDFWTKDRSCIDLSRESVKARYTLSI